MIEAGMRLRPAPADGGTLLNHTLVDLLDGSLDVRLGRSLLCYFAHAALSSDGSTNRSLINLEAPGVSTAPKTGALICNTQAAFSFVTGESDDLSNNWQQLISWVPETDEAGLAKEAEAALSAAPVDAQESPSSQTVGKEEATDSSQIADSDFEHTAQNSSAEDHRASTASHDDVHGESANDETRPEKPTEQKPIGIVGDGVRFTIGTTIDGVSSQPVEFWPSNTALNQMNMGVVGDLGTGKTQFLKSVVHQLREGAENSQPTPISMLIFDYKRDYHDESFLENVGGRLLRPFHIPLNVLAIDGEYTPQRAVQVGGAFVDVITRIYGGIGPVQKSKVLVIIKDLFAEGNGVAPTLGEVLKAYLDANSFDSVAAVLNGFVLNEVFSENASELVTMEELLQDTVLVLAVSDLGADDSLKTALITLFLNKYYEYMLRLKKWPFEGEAPHQMRRLNSFVLVDEATNIMHHEFPVLSQLLLQGREFGVGVILASQYVSHFKVGKANYGETLLTKLVHKVPNTSVAELKAFGIPSATSDMASKVPTLAVHQALCDTLDVPARFMRGTPYFELAECW